jgi:hypothetical protein
MSNLQDALLKKMLEIQKLIIKEEQPNNPPKQVEPKTQPQQKNPAIAIEHRGPRTIKCRHCGREVLIKLLDQHNREMHSRNLQNKEINSQDKNTTTRTNEIDGQQVTYKKRFVPDVAEQTTKSNPEEKNAHGEKNTSSAKPTSAEDIKLVSNLQLSSTEDFKMPDAWVFNRYKTNEELTKETITIGLDFGTSYTKACINFGDTRYIVDWSGLTNFNDKHTLPSELSYFSDRSFQVGRAIHAKSVASSLKIPLLEKQQAQETLDNAVNYISLVLNYIRSWWLHHHGNLVKNNSLSWLVNIGAPSEKSEDSYWNNTYKKLVSDAWIKSYTNDNQRSLLHEDDITVIPEFVAEIASYIKSPQRQSDLHLLIDIGGGTIDIVTFNIHRDENDEEVYPIFDYEVANLGTHYLMAERIHGTTKPVENLQSMKVLNTKEFAGQFNIDLDIIEYIDTAFIEKLKTKILKVLAYTKKHRYYKSVNWQNGIRTFICGGGAQSSIYMAAINKVKATYNLSTINLPLPDNLIDINLSKENFHRVSVAYGLSFDAMNLGNIRKKTEVPDIKKPELPERKAITDFDDGT